ncbi:MAG: hypothetical protein ABFS45_21865 [Pseudomonadota bacterium]
MKPLDLSGIAVLSNQTNTLYIAAGSNPSTPSPPPTYRHGPRSDTEKVFDIDRQLDESLSEFDGKLLREKRLLDDLEDTTKGEGSSTDGESEGKSPGQLSSEGKLADPASRPEEQTKTTSSERKNAGQSERHGSDPDPIPPDIPDGKDDDIVARQIREAAESEQDPALRNKLWDEYRKYKQNTGP